jgi:hypothetical protein
VADTDCGEGHLISPPADGGGVANGSLTEKLNRWRAPLCLCSSAATPRKSPLPGVTHLVGNLVGLVSSQTYSYEEQVRLVSGREPCRCQ